MPTSVRRKRNQIRHPLVETVEPCRMRLAVCGRSSFLGFCPSLHHRITRFGLGKTQEHSNEVEPADLANVLIDKAQMGLACVNSWGAIPLPRIHAALR